MKLDVKLADGEQQVILKAKPWSTESPNLITTKYHLKPTTCIYGYVLEKYQILNNIYVLN